MDAPFFDDNRNRGYTIALSGLKTALRVLVLILLIVAVFYAAKRLYGLGYEAFSAKPAAETAAEGESIAVVVTESMSLRDIGRLLIDNGLINESLEAFVIQANVYGYADKIVPGAYVLNTSMTAVEMMEFMSPSEEDEENQG